MKNLSQCKFKKTYIMFGFDEFAPYKIKRRLCELGFTVGQEITLVRKSLLGKAFLVELRGYTLSIRSAVAKAVIVE